MDDKTLKDILKLDKGIRSVFLFSNKWELLGSEHNNELSPLLSTEEENKALRQAYIRIKSIEMFSNKLGTYEWSVTKTKKAYLTTIVFPESYLLLSLQPDSDFNKITKEITLNFI